ncbi:hypothetical protein TNCV_3682451 [Trichonephila clavipes]|uniref:Uncharacterized protein n=1 Tax=Trichonephila clavipes TaxID=2585209 RepID=A0A8X6RG78_TRICX|nr:hypothetical protein TNCV_3682451 [Trichonephila clavipes]
MEVVLPRIEKSAGAPSCINHTFWCAVAGTICNNSIRSGKFAKIQVSSTHLQPFKFSPSFGHVPRLVHRPPDAYCYHDLHCDW